MPDPGYDVAVCWRIYPGVSKDPLFFKEDKYRLARLSFLSFLKSAEGLRIKYFILLDGCPDSFESIFTENVPSADIELIRTSSIGNASTFRRQTEILSRQTDASLVYFAEDDYLYRPFVFGKMVSFFKNGKPVDFITPYDHLDYYEHSLHRKKGEEIFFEELKWKTVASTCLSFLTTKENLTETLPVLLSYCSGNTDGSMWVTLTRRFAVIDLIKYLFTNKECYFILKKAMKYSFWKFLSGKKYYLWCPVPAVATHLESGHISPGIDWNNVKDEILKESNC